MPLARLERTRRAYCRCGGDGWVCEDHPSQPWPHAGCGGAGDPCPACNALATSYVNGKRLVVKNTAWNVIEGESH